MIRAYENTAFSGRRLNSYVAICVVVFVYGIWEIYTALTGPEAGATGFDLTFGIVFIAGGIYGVWQTFRDGRDLVVALDTGAGEMARLTLWRPFRRIQVEAPVKAIANWRFWVKSGPAGSRAYVLYADFPGYPRTLQFDLKPGAPAPEGLRAIAPAAIADFEENTGVRKDESGPA